jgi:putative GTP pyrophosphokinase
VSHDKLTTADQKFLLELVDHYRTNQNRFITLLDQLRPAVTSDVELARHIHSIKWRTKDPKHLFKKLARKMQESKTSGKRFPINAMNLFSKVNDLAGFRILHLYTRQFEVINDCLMRLFEEYRYELLEGPEARTWDDESREYFEAIGVACKSSTSLYTSVHYIIAPNTQKRFTCEIQVRTLAEELWGEVNHTLNYPEPSDSVACREQLKVLARVTSSCSRLVDSIFASVDDFNQRPKRSAKRKRGSP